MKYAVYVILDEQLDSTDPINNPFNHGIILSDPRETLKNLEVYKNIVGRLLYMGFTRLDLSYATQQLSQHMQSLCKHQLQAAHYVLRYLKGIINCGILYPTNTNLILKAYCDAD